MTSTYNLVREAIRNKQIVTGTYDGFYREMCPHVIGRGPSGNEQCLFYQFAGESKSGLGPDGSRGNWRCIPLKYLENANVVEGPWHTAPNHSRPQRCVAHIDLEVAY